MMEAEEKNMIRVILEDVETLKGKVEGMEGMLETLIERYTDAFYEVKEAYLEKIEEIRKERGKVFSSIDEFEHNNEQRYVFGRGDASERIKEIIRGLQ